MVAALPDWKTQITLRALIVGTVLGAVFSFITMRFSLGPGGIVPTFNMPLGAHRIFTACSLVCAANTS